MTSLNEKIDIAKLNAEIAENVARERKQREKSIELLGRLSDVKR